MKVLCKDANGVSPGVLKEGAIYEAFVTTNLGYSISRGFIEVIGENGVRSGPWYLWRFQVLEDETTKAEPTTSSKTYKGQCPCGIQHPTACEYHQITA